MSIYSKLTEKQAKVIVAMQTGVRVWVTKGLYSSVRNSHDTLIIGHPTISQLEEKGYIEKDYKSDEWRWQDYKLSEKGISYNPDAPEQATSIYRPSDKHIKIFKTILTQGWYRPRSNDQEPATKKLTKLGIIEWDINFSKLTLTDLGKQIVDKFIDQINK